MAQAIRNCKLKAAAIGVFQEYYKTHQLRNRSEGTVAWVLSLEVFMLFAMVGKSIEGGAGLIRAGPDRIAGRSSVRSEVSGHCRRISSCLRLDDDITLKGVLPIHSGAGNLFTYWFQHPVSYRQVNRASASLVLTVYRSSGCYGMVPKETDHCT